MVFNKTRLALTRNLTLANLQDRLARVYPNRTFAYLAKPLAYECLSTDRLTHEDARNFISRTAEVLTGLGLQRGERVALCTMNNVDLPMIIFAVIRAGGIAVPLNFMLKGREIRYIAENCGARMLFVDSDVFASNIGDKEAIPSIEHWIMTGPASEVKEGFLSLDAMLSGGSGDFEPAGIDPDDVAAIFYTSGTTGKPKGAMTTSRSLLTNQKIASLLLPVGKKDFGVFALPAAHVMGFSTILIGLCAGIKGYFIPHFNPEEVLGAIEKYRATIFAGVPAMFSLMLKSNPEQYDLSSIRMWGSAADAMPETEMKALKAYGAFLRLGRLKIRSIFAECYGMVELSGAATIKIALPGLTFPPGCVGFPVPPTRLRIMDDTGRKVRRNEVGEVMVKGPAVTKGYWNDEGKTGESLVDGEWFRTGDLGKKDWMGRVFFVDRKKDVIKCGGYSIFSVEVEEEMLEHPDLSHVTVIGVPHPTKGEMPIAVVTLKSGVRADADEVLAWARENIAAYKAPRAVKIAGEGDMPYGMTLKVLKRKLRERYCEEFTAGSA